MTTGQSAEQAVIVLEFALTGDQSLAEAARIVLDRLAEEPKIAGLVGGHLAIRDDAAAVLAVFRPGAAS